MFKRDSAVAITRITNRIRNLFLKRRYCLKHREGTYPTYPPFSYSMHSRLSLTRSSPLGSRFTRDMMSYCPARGTYRSEERQLYSQATNLFNLCSTDATSQEKLILKVYNPDFRTSDEEMMARLKEADLESHGYKKEQTTKLVSEPGSAQPVYEKKLLLLQDSRLLKSAGDYTRIRDLDAW